MLHYVDCLACFAGIEVIDPARKKDVEEWGPPVDDPRYFVPQKADRRSDYHIEPAFIATPDIKIYEGLSLSLCVI